LENKEVQTRVSLSQVLELQRKRVKGDGDHVIWSTVFMWERNKILMLWSIVHYIIMPGNYRNIVFIPVMTYYDVLPEVIICSQNSNTVFCSNSIWFLTNSSVHVTQCLFDTDPGVVPTVNLGMSIHHWYHKWVHPGAGHPVCIWWICQTRAPNIVSCRGRGIAMEPYGKTSAFQLGSGQWSRDTYTVQGSGEPFFSVENGLIEPNLDAHAPKGL
jgi:hypothetical protein